MAYHQPSLSLFMISFSHNDSFTCVSGSLDPSVVAGIPSPLCVSKRLEKKIKIMSPSHLVCATSIALVTWCCVFISLVQAQRELKVETIYKPEVCDVKSQIGKELTMHYTGTLEDGTKFDSRSEQNIFSLPQKFSISSSSFTRTMCLKNKLQLLVSKKTPNILPKHFLINANKTIHRNYKTIHKF